ncbi:MAG: DUF167 domain-containing protein [Pleurocapsa minor GSE-CHR-MK-17-07R]|nr:DUF167 domain-containing protein [Pleurocapsa minor GSE-CHR-MK 17-07R]
MTRKFEITDVRGGAALTVRVVTQSETTEIASIQDGILRIRLIAQEAGDAAANAELIGFLAAKLEVSMDKVQIVAGEGGREKLITIEGLSVEHVNQLLGS